MQSEQKSWITQAGYRALTNEYERLWHIERPRITQEVSEAAAQGDRSENAEYIYGKKRLREIDRRLRFLADRLKRVEIYNTPQNNNLNIVFFGCVVSLFDTDTQKQVHYRIVGSDEIDLKKNWISVESPLGQAVLNKKIGHSVLVSRPKGDTEFIIHAIKPYP